MIDPKLVSYIRREISRQMTVILQGVAGENTNAKETIENLYPGSDSLLDRPKMQPYGFASVARRGTLSVVGKQGENPGNRIVLGHRDAEAPTDLDDGTAKMYSADGFQVYAATDGVYVGNGSADEPLALGTASNDLFGQMLELLAAHVHGPPGTPPTNSAQFTQLKTQIVDTNKILSTGDGGLT